MKARTRRRTLLEGLFVAVIVISVVAFVLAAPEEKTRFLRAVQQGDARTVAALLNRNKELARLEQPYGKGSGSTPVLRMAVLGGHSEIVELLIAHGARPDAYPDVLRCAGNVEMARLLIEHGADINGQGEDGDAALHMFAGREDISILEFLLSQGANVNVRSRQGETPLHHAAQEGCLKAARLLVSKGADVSAKTQEGKTPLDYAAFPVWNEDAHRVQQERIRKCKEVGLYLLSCGAPCTVFDPAWLGDVERLRQQLADDMSLANAQANGEPLLLPAIRGGSAEAVEYLLAHGARLDVTGRFQQTPLQVAACVGSADVADVLLKHGADADARGPKGETALHWAAVRGNTDVAACLLHRGADPNIQTTGHIADLNLLAEDRNPVERELEWFRIEEDQRRYGGQVMVLPRLAFTGGDTPLHAAAYWNHPDIVALLASRGADVKKTNRWGVTALHLAAVSRHADVAQRLLDAGADPQTRTQNGMTAVDLARHVKDKKLVRILTARKSR